MRRFFYRCLIRLHPRAFRERFGDEMLCVFEEAEHAAGSGLLADAAASLMRQWILRSGLWRWTVGAGMTAMLIVGYAHSEANWAKKQVAAQELIDAKRARPLNQAEFNREAAEAVAMLARFRIADKRKSHPSHSRQSGASDETAQD
ncbi:MAG TPA: hypothetical protein VJN69_04815 [Candidatus Acidoferrales bacterium]|nr:hypothetical protein [Candidatus Acidoferrales bacterium]